MASEQTDGATWRCQNSCVVGVLLRERAAHETTGHAGILGRDKTYPVSVCLKDVRFVKGISSCNIFMRPEDQHCCSCLTDRSSPTGTAASSYFFPTPPGLCWKNPRSPGAARRCSTSQGSRAGLAGAGSSPTARTSPVLVTHRARGQPARSRAMLSVPALFLPPSPLLTGYIMCYHLCLFV